MRDLNKHAVWDCRSYLTYYSSDHSEGGNKHCFCKKIVSVVYVVVGTTGVSTRPVSHSRERLFDVRCNAALGAVCRPCPPRQNRLRRHGVCRQGLTLYCALKPQSYGPPYSNTVIGTLAVDGWAVTFGIARRGLGGAAARPGPSSLYPM